MRKITLAFPWRKPGKELIFRFHRSVGGNPFAGIPGRQRFLFVAIPNRFEYSFISVGDWVGFFSLRSSQDVNDVRLPEKPIMGEVR